MNQPPEYLDGAKVLFWTELESNNQLTDKLRLYAGGAIQTAFHGLAIAAYEKDQTSQNHAIYLFFCDRDWEVQNDTCHDSIDEAKEQASETFTNSNYNWITK